MDVQQACNHEWILIEDGDTHVHPLQDPLVVTQQAEQQPAAPLEDTDSNPIAAKRTKRNEEDKDQKDRAVVEETTRNGNSTCASTNTEQERVMVESTRKPESDSAETRSPYQKETWFDAVVKNHGHHPRHESFVVTSRDHTIRGEYYPCQPGRGTARIGCDAIRGVAYL